jgi:hypothetical protein
LQVLQPPLGVVLVAAKSFYFGVGGGVKSFKQAVKADGLFEVTHVYRTSACVLGPSATATAPASKGGNSCGDERLPAGPASARGPSNSGAVEPGKPGAGKSGAGLEGGSVALGGGAAQRSGTGSGGNVREVLQLAFPQSILPYFL